MLIIRNKLLIQLLLLQSMYLAAHSSELCSINIGAKIPNDSNLHRRMVETDIHSSSGALKCKSSRDIKVNMHDGIQKSFHMITAKNTKSNGRKFPPKSTKDDDSYDYWYGEDQSDGSILNYVTNGKGSVSGSLIDLTNDEILQFQSVEGSSVSVTIKKPSDFKNEMYVNDDTSPEMIEEKPLVSDFIEEEDEPVLEEMIGSPIVEEKHNETRRKLRRGSNKKLQFDIAEKVATFPKKEDHQHLVKSSPFSSTSSLSSLEGTRSLLDDSGGYIDVLVVWTERAECLNYFRTSSCTLSAASYNSMVALVELAVQETNTAYAATGIGTELNLVHKYRLDGWTEQGMSTTLNMLRDKLVPGVHDKRGQYGADVVSMITADSGCGIGWVGPSVDMMTSVTRYSCATGGYTFGHEIGHNMGLLHDRGAEDSCDTSAHPGYIYGYQDPQSRFRTVMAYNCDVNSCLAPASNGCPRVPRFSSSSHTYSGFPLGSAFEDSTRKIKEVKAEIAGYYKHGVPNNYVGIPHYYTGGTWGSKTGTMFDLETSSAEVTLYGITIKFGTAQSNKIVQIYATSASDTSFVGKETIPSSWTKLMETTTSWNSYETKTFTLDFPVTMSPNTVRGIYVTTNGGYGSLILRTNGPSVGDVIDSTSELSIKQGTWNTHAFGSFSSGYGFVGTIKYLIGGVQCSSDADCDDGNPFTQDTCTNDECQYNVVSNVCGNMICEPSNDEYCSTCPSDCTQNCNALGTSTSTTRYYASVVDGMMIDIVAASDITIYELEVRVASCDDCTVELYTKSGSYVGSEQVPSAWTQLFSGTKPSQSPPNFVTIPFDEPVPISSGSRQSFYFTFTTGYTLLYGRDLDGGNVMASNGDLTIFGGKLNQYRFGSVLNGYARFFGGISYENGLITCFENCTPDTAAPSSLPLSPSTSPSQEPSLFPSQGPSTSPSQEPSLFPSQGPSTSPSQEPSMSPIQGDVSDSPSTTPAPCEDTSLSFQVSNGVFETCAYVGENVQERCTRKVQLACPKTCLACDTCADFSSKFQFQKRGVTKTSKCEKKANEKTCKRIDGLAELCRESCGLCPA